MSGPIVRKYGFPNHEQIFGRRPPEHGAEEPKKDEPKPADPEAAADETPKPETKAKTKAKSKTDQRGAD